MANYQNAPRITNNYKNASLNKIRTSAVIACTKHFETQISAIRSPLKLGKI